MPPTQSRWIGHIHGCLLSESKALKRAEGARHRGLKSTKRIWCSSKQSISESCPEMHEPNLAESFKFCAESCAMRVQSLVGLFLFLLISISVDARSSAPSCSLEGCSSIHSSLPPSVFKERPHLVSIAQFGAVGDGATINTKAFEDAIYHISNFAERGGATLYIPKGRWLTGCFNLISHVTLFLDRGATILASQDPKDWPVVDPLPSYGRGRELPGARYTSLIHGYKVTDVAITGNNGTIDGQGSVWWSWFKAKQTKYTRGSLLEFMFSTNILVYNVTLIDSPFWTLHPVYCSNMVIKAVTILAPHKSPNTDGIDPDSSSNICIQDCYISNGDDAIAVKSGWDEYGLRFNHPSHDIFIHNLTVSGSHGISLGSEMSGGIYNVRVEDVSISEAVQAIHIKTSAGRGAYIHNSTFSNFQVFNTGVAFAFTALYGDHPDDKYDPSAFADIRDISISNVVGSKVNRAGDFRGVRQSPFRGVCLSEISLQVASKKDWNCSYVEGSSKNVSPAPCTALQAESSACSQIPCLTPQAR